MRDTPTHVYIIAAGDFIKIGISVDPRQRLKGMSTGMAEKAHLFASKAFPTGEMARKIERRMHWAFRDCRERGEWFRLSPATAWAKLRITKVPTPRNEDADYAAAWERIFSGDKTLM